MTVRGIREEAKRSGLIKYQASMPCEYGHTPERYTSNNVCVECQKQRHAEWREKNNRPDYVQKPRSKARALALKRGDRTYFTGKPCNYGHISRRYTNNYACVKCSNIRKVKLKKEDYDNKNNWERNGYPPTRPMPDNCEVCGKSRKGRRLHLDHDHKTNKFRGWLCMGCNTAIGKLGDDLNGVMKAVLYLKNIDIEDA